MILIRNFEADLEVKSDEVEEVPSGKQGSNEC